MTKRNTTHPSIRSITSTDHKTTRITADEQDTEDEGDEEAEQPEDVEVEDEHRANSVVGAEYKRRYAERAAAMVRKPKGVSLKALKRSNTDWLAIELAKRVLDDKLLAIHGLGGACSIQGYKLLQQVVEDKSQPLEVLTAARKAMYQTRKTLFGDSALPEEA